MAKGTNRGRQRLTKASVEAVPPRQGTSVYVGDSEVPGFCVRVYAWRGRVRRVYVYRYTPRGAGRGARTRYVTIGEHGAAWSSQRPGAPARGGTLTADLARAEALWLRGIRNAGGDPAAAYTAAAAPPPAPRGVPTFREFSGYDGAREGELTYLSHHADLHKSYRSAKEDRGLLERYLLRQAWADLPLDELGPEHVSALMARLAGTPTAANRCRSLVSHMITMARTWRVLPPTFPNPCGDLKRFREGRRKRFLLEGELARVGAAMVVAEALWRRPPAERVLEVDGERRRLFALDPVAAAAIRVIMFTGSRPTEIITLRDEQLQYFAEQLEDGSTVERALAVQHAKRGDVAGERVILFPPPAVAQVRSSPRREGNPFVFPSPITRGRHLSLSHVEVCWRAIRIAAGLGEDVPLYVGTRHTFGGTAASRGEGLPVLGGVMGHSNQSTTQRYAHLAAGPQRRLSDETAAAIARALAGAL